MYEDNDLYNIDLDDETAPSQSDDEIKEPVAEPKETEPKAPVAEPKESPESTERKITQEQYEYLEKARQKDELSGVVNDIKSRIPDFDFSLVAKKLLEMSESDQKRYYNPQGLELLWLSQIAPNLSHNGKVDVARNTASLDMDELTDKISKGTQSMDEELQFYLNLK